MSLQAALPIDLSLTRDGTEFSKCRGNAKNPDKLLLDSYAMMSLMTPDLSGSIHYAMHVTRMPEFSSGVPAPPDPQ